jgi:hypothetical protein
MSLFSDVFSLPVHFEFFAIFSYCLNFAKFVCLLKRLQRLKQEWQKSPSGTRQIYGNKQLGLVWRNRKKISQIIKDYFYLPFFLLIILCLPPSSLHQLTHKTEPYIDNFRCLSWKTLGFTMFSTSRKGVGQFSLGEGEVRALSLLPCLCCFVLATTCQLLVA